MKKNPISEQLNLSRNERRSLFLLGTLFLISCILTLYADKNIIIYNNASIDQKLEPKNPSQSINTESTKNDFPIVQSEPNQKKSYPNLKKDNVLSLKTKSQKQYKKPKELKLTRHFDPNTITETELLDIGINSFAAKNWTKFISAGAHYDSAESLKSIYGLTANEYDQLKAFLSFPTTKEIKILPKKKKVYPKKILEINSVDVSTLQTLYGLGPILSERIINFRDKLGGFYSLEQLEEVYGLPDTTITHILPYLTIKPQLDKISLNSITYESLKKHPYITPKQAKIILRYQLQHGPFTSIDQLQKLKVFEDDHLVKLTKYITI